MNLFDPLRLRDVQFRNRIAVSPMCQYSSQDGFADDWHLVHLGSRAVGGAGLVIAEASAVVPEGRISPQDLGIWKPEHVPFLSRITRFIDAQGSVAGIQLAHAGRKASTYRPWSGSGMVPPGEGGWTDVVAPSAIRFAPDYPEPVALDKNGIRNVIDAFAEATGRSLEAGFRVVEIHAAHGYLLHQFLSPLSNRREDEYGGSFENRTRLVREVVQAVREVWPAALPLLVRLSATDWVQGGWDLDQTVRLAKELVPLGVDMIDCSTGGNVPNAQIPAGLGYQVPFAQAVQEAGIPAAAVGLIVDPAQANAIVAEGKADMVLLARAMLRDPYFPIHAAQELGIDVEWPKQYQRAKR